MQAWGEGNKSALERLVPLVYEQLHRLARHYMARERAGHTLQTGALPNEAYLRLVDSAQPSWQNRARFFAVGAQAMRRILVDWARSRRILSRCGTGIPSCAVCSGHRQECLCHLRGEKQRGA